MTDPIHRALRRSLRIIEPAWKDEFQRQNGAIEAAWRAGRISDENFNWWLMSVCGA